MIEVDSTQAKGFEMNSRDCDVMNIVQLVGITQRGKNRVNENGALFIVVTKAIDGPIGMFEIGSIMVSSIKKPAYIAWIKPNDDHFQIVSIFENKMVDKG